MFLTDVVSALRNTEGVRALTRDMLVKALSQDVLLVDYEIYGTRGDHCNLGDSLLMSRIFRVINGISIDSWLRVINGMNRLVIALIRP